MQYFPLFVDTKELKVLVVGAGEVATRKLDLLSRTEAIIDVIAPDVADEVLSYQKRGRISLFQRSINTDDITGYDLLYMATANAQLNMDYAVIAREKGIWVNVVDNPSYCRFITPSIVDRGRLVVAISTAGAAPVFARTIRSRLETMLPQSLNPLFDFVASKREEVQQRITSGKDRRLFWERFFQQNNDRYDTVTENHYQEAFSHDALAQVASQGEMLLFNKHDDANLLPIAAMPLLQKIDVFYTESERDASTDIINELVRRDASREILPSMEQLAEQYNHGDRVLLVVSEAMLTKLKAHFPMAKHLQPGAL